MPCFCIEWIHLFHLSCSVPPLIVEDWTGRLRCYHVREGIPLPFRPMQRGMTDLLASNSNPQKFFDIPPPTAVLRDGAVVCCPQYLSHRGGGKLKLTSSPSHSSSSSSRMTFVYPTAFPTNTSLGIKVRVCWGGERHLLGSWIHTPRLYYQPGGIPSTPRYLVFVLMLRQCRFEAHYEYSAFAGRRRLGEIRGEEILEDPVARTTSGKRWPNIIIMWQIKMERYGECRMGLCICNSKLW